ncbi:GNAT family N-acetyltransferase [Glaciihabitans sp. dw_435]|uniref:GNAT family N-acetyltransferase n=1 Tax=Glaciihabitans sp. dw_435 TaxID=2720081 RepID=UPI001BD6D908|nr:GNAT family N-acetyltransferase [Glaciihabitans sp. dw_435]
MNHDYQHAPIDPQSAALLATQGLEFRVVDSTNREEFANWVQAEARGFHDGVEPEDTIAAQFEGLTYRRSTGVWDATAAEPHMPVASVSSFPTDITVPGRRAVNAWAISAVTVSPTHRRKGIARAMLESELRTAVSLGHSIAALTVSEATIYGRFGFSPAALAANYSIDSRRVSWTGAEASGRVHFVSLEEIRRTGPALMEQTRLDTPGEIAPWPLLWDRWLGVFGDPAVAKKLRAVRYDDADGVTQGFAIYSMLESETVPFGYSLDLKYLSAITPDAYAGLWQFLLAIDLVSEIRAPLRSTDEAFRWQVSDFRGVAKTRETDHLWTRILDVPAALTARAYAAPGTLVLRVSDPLGFAEGDFVVTVGADGEATSESLSGDVPDDAAVVSLSVNDLSSLYLGGVSAVTLVRAGRMTEETPGAAVAVDAAFHSPVTPWLSIWF